MDGLSSTLFQITAALVSMNFFFPKLKKDVQTRKTQLFLNEFSNFEAKSTEPYHLPVKAPLAQLLASSYSSASNCRDIKQYKPLYMNVIAPRELPTEPPRKKKKRTIVK